MDFAPHWATMCKCNLCGEIPDVAPLYHCQFKHQFCSDCFEELRRNYRGNIDEGCTCPTCKVSGKFEKSKINTDFLRKLKIKPGIGRPFRYSSKIINSCHPRSGFTTTDKSNNITHNPSYMNNNKYSHKNGIHNNGEPHNVTIEDLFQLSTSQVQKLLRKKSNRNLHHLESEDEELVEEEDESYEDFLETSRSDQAKTSLYFQSRKPLQCPHSACKKTVAVLAFVNHFRYEHKNIPVFNAERGRVVTVPIDLTVIEHGVDNCLAMITVYEINKIDVIKSKSSKSVLRTCNKFSQSVPINTFWLMVSASDERKPYLSYAFYWLFTNTDDSYHCTIEIASKKDTFNISTFCYVNNTMAEMFSNIPESLNCLMLTHNAFAALLKEGVELKLRVTIH